MLKLIGRSLIASSLLALSVSWVRAGMPEVDALPAIKELPDPFRMNDGSRVATREDWKKRRAEIAEILQFYEYGHLPPAPGNVKAEEIHSTPVFDGAGTLVEGKLALGPEQKIHARISYFVPAGKPGPFPVVLAVAYAADKSLRAAAESCVRRGYILAGYERADFDRDDADRTDGVHPLYPDSDWGTLGAWAWGAQRVVDYLVTLPEVDKSKIAITGHSRAGKTAMLAAALDERITLVAPSGSGAGGAGCYRILGHLEKESESLAAITDPKRFAYWFTPRLRTFVGKEDRLPFDQHFLKAMIAPRPLLCMEGLADFWANPVGTQQTTAAAEPVYEFLGASGKNCLWYRPGGHAMNDENWAALLDFCDCQFFGKATTRDFHMKPYPDEAKAFTWATPGSR